MNKYMHADTDGRKFGQSTLPTHVYPRTLAALPPSATQQFPLATPEALLARASKRFQGCRRLLAQHHGQIGIVVPHELAAFLTPLRLPLAAVVRLLKQEAARAEGREEEEGESGENGAAAAAVVAGETDEGAAVLALHGWEAGVLLAAAAGGGGPSLASASASGWVLGCGLCGRRVEAARLLARRSSASLSPRGNSPTRGRAARGGGGGQQAQQQGGEWGKVDFDPVEQHRYYCPWATAGLEGGGDAPMGAEAGWRRVGKVVASRTPRAWFLPGGGGGGGDGGGQGEGEEGMPQKPDDMYNAAMNLLHSF